MVKSWDGIGNGEVEAGALGVLGQIRCLLLRSRHKYIQDVSKVNPLQHVVILCHNRDIISGAARILLQTEQYLET
jgi:hypothetical protein